MRNAKLQTLLEPGAEALGFEILDVELLGSERSKTLRVYIDGPDGVTVDDCAAVSHQLSVILDVEDPIHARYTLEVSSPGLDRPLSKPDHFAAVIGEQVKLQLHEAEGGRRRFTGTLIRVAPDQIEVEVDGERRKFRYGDIAKARLAPDYDALMKEL